MVPQDTVLFNDSIGYNIRYGRWGASDAEVREAARLAQIDRFIASVPVAMRRSRRTRLKLSGGEKQRVAIARTILKGPPIVLDEATSALDSFTEHEIQEALTASHKGRTTLVIAHRLSTVVDADEIIFLDHGHIVERGTHQQLLAKGAYAAMWSRQRQADADEEPSRRGPPSRGTRRLRRRDGGPSARRCGQSIAGRNPSRSTDMFSAAQIAISLPPSSTIVRDGCGVRESMKIVDPNARITRLSASRRDRRDH